MTVSWHPSRATTNSVSMGATAKDLEVVLRGTVYIMSSPTAGKSLQYKNFWGVTTHSHSPRCKWESYDSQGYAVTRLALLGVDCARNWL